MGDTNASDPTRITTLAELATAFGWLRRRAAGSGRRQVSVRELAVRTRRAPSTLDVYLRGQRLCPAELYEEMLRALGVPNERLRPWLDAWERLAEAYPPGRPPAPTAAPAPHRPQPHRIAEEFLYTPRLPRPRTTRVGIVTGDVRRVRCADVWVNPENTQMSMPRIEEHSVSAVIRFEGAERDVSGRVVEDSIANELAARVDGRTPVAPGTAVVTGAGRLKASNGVRWVVHVAAVHGEPGEGYRQILDIGRCVTTALTEIERLAGVDPDGWRILIPLLGTGMGGGDPEQTAAALLGATLDYLSSTPDSRIDMVYFLAYTNEELRACRAVFDASALLAQSPGH